MTAARWRPGRRKRWLLLGTIVAVLCLVPAGCSMLPSFEPAIATPAMAAAELASRFFDTPEGSLHVVVASANSAPARVLFIHGSPGTWDAWSGFLRDPELRRRARLLAADRLGFGGSERGHAEPSLTRQAAALAAVLDQDTESNSTRTPLPTVVVGHSLGGPIAVRLAIDRPDLVDGLLLVAPSIDPQLERRRWYNVAAATWVVQWFLPQDWVVSNRELWPLRRELATMLPGRATVRCPTVVVQGMEDHLVPAANADFAAKMLPADIRVDRHPEGTHFILWQQPESVRTPLLELLSRARAAGLAPSSATG
jgi:pimeloyl-ACP methyl ester carboxylesterase